MKPLNLVIQAFGPYPGREEIDFKDLANAGIFLIKGPTGSGKTTIFDAMSMALYGKSTVEDDKSKTGRNRLEVWRCNQAPEKTETIVEFTFEANNNIYRFSRRLVPKRVRLDQVNAISLMDENGVFQTIVENPKDSVLNAKAEEIIGLNSNQFRQVVLLPQGQFERFLTADASEKEQILGKLFDASKWARIASDMYDKADARKRSLEEEKKTVDNLLSEEGEGFESIDSLGEHIKELRDSLEVIENRHKEFGAEDKQVKLNADKKLAEQYDRLSELDDSYQNLLNKADEIEASKQKLILADKAEKLREPIKRVDEYSEEYKRRADDLKNLESKTTDLQADVEKAKRACEQHKEEDKSDEYNGQIAVLETKRAIYESIDEVASNVRSAEEALSIAEKDYNEQKALLDELTEEAKCKFTQKEKAEKTAIDYRNRYFSGIYGEIALKLEEDTPCPVCGSKSHPMPAKRNETAVSKEEMEAAEDASTQASKEWEAAENNRSDADSKLRGLENAFNNAKNQKNSAELIYEEQAKNLVEGINNTKELDNKIFDLKSEIAAYSEKTTLLEEVFKKANDLLTKHGGELDSSKNEYEKSKKLYEKENASLSQILSDNGYPDIESAKRDMIEAQERDDIKKSMTEYETNLSNIRTEIEGQSKLVNGTTKPDTNSFEERQNQIDSEIRSYTTEQTKLSEEIKRLDKKHSDLSVKLAHYNTNIKEAESDWAFAKTLRGDTGIGLYRYVLGIMFGQIIAEANNMLKMVHGGRYQLYRTDEKGSGNKRGLELLVNDNRRPEEKGRPVTSLSGGEKFLVSLSLSIGMSAVAQKSGLHIEALFIDEGFGTLDDGSISDAMDILEHVQKSNGMIGIISHVSVLENTISKHIEIIKTNKGSSISLC